MAPEKTITVMGVRPVARTRYHGPRIELDLALEYLRGAPITPVVVSPRQAVELMAELARAVLVTSTSEELRG